MKTSEELEGIAVIGMSGRFPKARNLEEFWQNLVDGVECISFPTAEEMIESGVDPYELSHPDYIRAGCFLDDIDMFDAAFFGISPKEAEIMDPQHRIFLETAWEALENAGYNPETYQGEIGVYGGGTMSTYMLFNLNPRLGQSLPLVLGNDKDYLSTRISYKLNLRGPSVTVQSACSTSLVAVSMACDNLLDHQCSMALAGGIATRVPHKRGYLYEQGGILSPDGHCRAFDARAQGTIFGSGVGVVTLKRLADAVADGDTIHAVIKGTAVNNDGSMKVGYTAPGVEGQARVIAMAQAMAGVSPDTISYVETHGTGTMLGDPIEVAALTQAFRAGTKRKGFCALASVKTNIGHADSAAGIAGFIKTVLALEHKTLPPSLNFEQPNPEIDFENSPFYVNSTLQDWKTNGTPRRAGVSAFGIGGTNAHAVLEEAPALEPAAPSRPRQLLVISARTKSALDASTRNLVAHLRKHVDTESLGDVAYTLGVGRQAFNHRRMLVCEDIESAITALEAADPKRVFSSVQETSERPIVFMFPGQGAQYVNMGRELYETEPAFAEQVDLCAKILQPHLGLDLRVLLYPNADAAASASEQPTQTRLTQPALFVIEYALAKLWARWGVQPRAMIGHSIGEYVAACLAGVFSLEDALALVAARGRLMQQLPGGSMLAVSLSDDEIRPLLNKGVSLAAINSPSLCVVSGATDDIESFQTRLTQQGVECRRLHTSHAFHSEMMAPILAPFTELVKSIGLKPPQVPYISNVTGSWITAQEATDPNYWARHLRHAVRFADGLRTLQEPGQILLEVGPGRSLSTFAKRQTERAAGQVVLTSMRHPDDQSSDAEFLLTAVGKLWLSGFKLSWEKFYADERRRRVPLPTYPFERKRYWLSLNQEETIGLTGRSAAADAKQQRRKIDLADWFYAPSWKRAPLSPQDIATTPGCTLIFAEDGGLSARLAEKLELSGGEVITVRTGTAFIKADDGSFGLNPKRSEDYDRLLAELRSLGKAPQNIVHLWSVTNNRDEVSAGEYAEWIQGRGFYSLLFLAQAFGRQDATDSLRLTVVSNNVQDVSGEEDLQPEKATLLGPVKVIQQEYPNITCRSIDAAGYEENNLAAQLEAELAHTSSDQIVAYRGNHRWVQTYEALHLKAPANGNPRLRPQGIYLITGGLGGVGLTLAEHLAKTVQAKLILTGRSALPPRAEWESWLNEHPVEDGTSGRIKKIQELEALGAEVMVVAADVSDRDEMRNAIVQATERFGQINGIVHSAGVPAGGIIQLKTPEMVESIFAPKIRGTLVLDEIFRDLPLDFFILCSSLSSVVGGFGQVDYCAANAFLDAYASRRNSENGNFTVSINWDAWRDVGMAAEAVKRQGGAASSADRATPQLKEVAHPLFDQCINGDADEATYITQFSALDHWVLSDHKVTGSPTLPGTAYLEMARAAFENHTGGGAIEIRDVLFLSPLMMSDSEAKEVHTVLKKQGEGFEFSVLSRPENGHGKWQEHARGRLAQVEASSAQTMLIDEIEARCDEPGVTVKGSKDQSQQDLSEHGFMEFGPRWNTLRQTRFGKDQGLALIEIPAAFADDLKTYKLHPAMLDCATGFLSARAMERSPYLPFGYKSIKINGAMTGKVYSYARFAKGHQPDTGTLKIDVSILDEQGRELVEIKEYMLRKIDVARQAKTEKKSAAPHPQAFTLQIASPGNLDTLRYQAAPRQAPRPGELEIEVSAASLNFKEVLMALGLFPVAPGGFGLECAGRVTAAGEGVEGFKVGDEVIALARNSFGPYVTVPHWMALKKPLGLTFEEAATIPVAFLTAYYSLITMGRLNRGERVLIHAAAGGVGMAAVQVAHWAGAEIFATAGNPEKRQALHSLGIEHVMNSRTLDFADEVMKRTNGYGVDVVLNSLGGEFIAKGLEVLAPFGRFLEIGKRDIHNNTQLGMRPFEKCLSFIAIDISPRDTPDLLSAWRAVGENFDAGTFSPLPRTVFPIDEVNKAFEYMATAAHIGKVVVSLDDKEALKRFAAHSEETAGSAAAQQWHSAAAGQSRVQGGLDETSAAISPRRGMVEPDAGLSPAEGAQAFSLILNHTQSQILVTPRDFLNTNFGKPQLSDSPAEAGGYRPSHPRPGLNNEYIAPRDETERAIAEIWQHLLGIEQVGIHDDFFELGGDSLLATQVISRLRDALKVDIAVGKMFEDATVSGLAALVEPARWSAQQQQTLPREIEGDREEGML